MISFPTRRWPSPHVRTKILEACSIAFLFTIIVGPASFLLWLAFFTSTFDVHNITVVDARDSTTDMIHEKMNSSIGENILFINTSLIKQRLLDEIPQLRDIYIMRKLPSTLKVIVQEKQPAVLLLSNKAYFVVDDHGLVFEEARLETLPGVDLPIVINKDDTSTVMLGSPAFEPSFVTFLMDIQQELPKTVDARIAHLSIPSLAARELHVQLNTNWLILFDTTRGAHQQLSVLERLLNGTVPEESQSKIDSIDLRIKNRVYYKLAP